MSMYDIKIRHMREIIDHLPDEVSLDDRNTLHKYKNDFENVSWHLEREERRIIECCKVLTLMTERFTQSTPAWVRDGINDAMAELRRL